MASSAGSLSNLVRARVAWGADMPAWVTLLATACDATNQRRVGLQLDKSSGYVSRLLSRSYAGSYQEAETLVRAKFGSEDVVCPLWGPIPLSSCVRNRRHEGPPRNHTHHLHAASCPTCPNNTDRRDAGEED